MSDGPVSREREIYAQLQRNKQREASVDRMHRAYREAPYPDGPLASRRAPTFAEALEGLRGALAELDMVPEADLDEPTRRLRDTTRAMLDRYDRDLGEVDGGGA